MSIDELKINQLIEIEFQESKHSRLRMPSRIEGVNGNHLVISMPTQQGRLIPIAVGREITIIVADQQGLFGGEARVKARYREPLPVLVVDKPRQFVRMEQRRDYVRLPISLPVHYTLVTEEKPVEEPVWREGTSRDLSAGGIFLISRTSMQTGQIVKLSFHLGDEEAINCRGRVVRNIPDILGDGKEFGAGIKFTSIKEAQEEKIFRFVFSKQREWLQKGLL